ncbi:hydroxymethylbilane synthase [Companilactobacillus sp.]|uniref:hydroxymethylbilane synthase n=1 Tax=Companilactobacillus sp. TaxID=2767905 RepID=UPI0025C6CADB|nr:hydroxymethylbilane synthase [Companilactobacillus sp.]MCH4008610.1 hydroxymethylbilane synthase [Companilactobacillus sp.]MCH4051211.1 hydroxymethylbilane synthase [Companilactobacillus sp.]MCH4076553.1 hydroxymethylbilane synthase [Companilactobacillus sp.]MCH4125128.1 hydroxymethylbilane synthase [Companilactobacillus sp.]MCH4131668.1 hydroxymethylbilane synthase [Companilactobacillus sp.]
MEKTIKVGTRKSKLAVCQTKLAIKMLQEQYPDKQFELCYITTEGDKNYSTDIKMIGGKGLFVKEIEQSLLDGKIDIAVHSLKDLLPQTPEGLVLSGIPKRNSPFDCLITTTEMHSTKDIPQGAKIGTSSIRRTAQLRHLRPDIEVVPIRGNLDTRLKKIDELNLFGVIVAESGLDRLQVDIGNHHKFSLQDTILPAAGQGALALESRADDQYINDIIHSIDDKDTRLSVKLERQLLAAFGGSCNFPVGAYAHVDDSVVTMHAMISSYDGSKWYETSADRSVYEATDFGNEIARELLSNGATEIIKEIEGSN